MALIIGKGHGKMFPRQGFKGKEKRNFPLPVFHGSGLLLSFHHKVHRPHFLRPFVIADGECALPFFYVLHGYKGHGVMVRFIGNARHLSGDFCNGAVEMENRPFHLLRPACIYAVISGSQGSHHMFPDMIIQIGGGIAPVELLLQGKHQGLCVRLSPPLRLVNSTAVGSYGVVDILHALHAPLHLERRHPCIKEIGNTLNAHHILQAQDIIAIMIISMTLIIHQMVGHAAGLGTGPPVSAAAAHKGTHEALAGIAHAEGAMDKDFDFHPRLLHNLFDFRKRQLPGQHHPLEPQGLHEKGTVQVRNGHLSGRMKRNGWSQPAGQRCHPQILHQKPV